MRDLRNLPPQVIDRLGDAFNERTAGFDIELRNRIYEARRTARIEIRRDDAGDPIFDGYATVYDVEYDVFGGPEKGGWTEVIVAGACDKSVRERDDVRLLINHDAHTAVGLPLARIASKTLELESDKIGLRVQASLDERNPIVAGLVSAMERDDVNEMSFAWRTMRQEWGDEYRRRWIKEAQVVDVTAATFPANDAAVAQLRSDGPAVDSGMSLTMARAIAATLN